jgi:hypothetical protein
VASTYDDALADALGDAEPELAERLRAGKADGGDRRSASAQLDDDARHRFELAHPNPPRETAIELDVGEVKLGDVKAAVKEAAAEHEGREVLVRVAVRVAVKDD